MFGWSEGFKGKINGNWLIEKKIKNLVFSRFLFEYCWKCIENANLNQTTQINIVTKNYRKQNWNNKIYLYDAHQRTLAIQKVFGKIAPENQFTKQKQKQRKKKTQYVITKINVPSRVIFIWCIFHLGIIYFLSISSTSVAVSQWWSMCDTESNSRECEISGWRPPKSKYDRNLFSIPNTEHLCMFALQI